MLTVFRVSSTLSDRLRDERGTRETRGCWCTRDSVCAFSLTYCRIVCVSSLPMMTVSCSSKLSHRLRDERPSSEICGCCRALVILCLVFLTVCQSHCLCQLPSNDDGFTCLQSFLSDCLTKDPSVKSEVAAARTGDSACCFLTDCCRVVCVSSHPMMPVSRVFKAVLATA